MLVSGSNPRMEETLVQVRVFPIKKVIEKPA
jgi:hypothetical protein